MANDKPIEDVGSEEDWDFEQAQKKPGVKSGRTVVSVAFRRDEFEKVSDAAEGDNMRTSEFIRKAALDLATKTMDVRSFSWTGGSAAGLVMFVDMNERSSSQVSSHVAVDPEPALSG